MRGALTAAVSALVLLGACGERDIILPGERLDIRPQVAGDAERAPPLSLPAPQVNADWTHRGGDADRAAGHAALAALPQPLFVTAIGEGDSRRARITASPVAAGGRVFAMDARAQVTAVDAGGAVLWTADVARPGDGREDASGGGLVTDGTRVYVTTGYGRLHALDAATGAEVWVQDLDAPGVAAPAIAEGRVFVVSRDARAWAVDAGTGQVLWRLAGTPAVSTFAGGAGPAVAGDMVVLPMPSGEILGAFTTGGFRRWSDVIAGSRPGQSGGIAATDLGGDPVIDGRTVYAANAGGRMAAVDLDTGVRLWSAGEGAASEIAVGGGSLFLVNDINELVRISAADGQVLWRVQLPVLVETRWGWGRPSVRHAHYGPVLAGGRLVVASSDGVLRFLDPQNGAFLGELALPGGAAAAPAVAQGTLYVVTRDGTLAAFR